MSHILLSLPLYLSLFLCSKRLHFDFFLWSHDFKHVQLSWKIETLRFNTFFTTPLVYSILTNVFCPRVWYLPHRATSFFTSEIRPNRSQIFSNNKIFNKRSEGFKMVWKTFEKTCWYKASLLLFSLLGFAWRWPIFNCTFKRLGKIILSLV